jgi:2-dehydro-3-deoxygluconokinase
MAYDVVTFGEAMLRLTPPAFRRLEQAQSFDAEVGGAELNTAVGLVRLGRSAAWVSRLPDNPLGRMLAGKVREAGVGTTHVELADDGRLGLYFLEVGAAPRASSILYDRRDSSFSHLKPDAIDWTMALAGAKWFHVTGITPALGPGLAAATLEALRTARAAGIRTSIDPNYRAKLWPIGDARRWLESALPLCDVLITGGSLAGEMPDAATLFGVPIGAPESVARALTKQFGVKIVAVTQRDSGQVWRNSFTAIAFAGNERFATRTFEVEVVDRLGAGDAFAAGLIHGLLDNDVQRGLDYGAAMAALKHTVPGDFPSASRAEVQDLLSGGGLRISR